jgi:dolichol-phosphate mannosyltransferase
LPNTYWVFPGRLLAGEHPGALMRADALDRLERLRIGGIDYYLDLTEPGEVPDYRHLLERRMQYVRSPIPDMHVPGNPSQTSEIIATIRAALAAERRVYVHCRAGIGRTGLIVGCLLAEDEQNGKEGLRRLNALWQQSARAADWTRVPQTSEQADYVRQWPKLRGLRAETLAPATRSRPAAVPATQSAAPGLISAPVGEFIVGPLTASDPRVRLSVVVPTYNEAPNIGELIRRLTAALDPTLGADYEIIVVDDDSPDRTWELALGLVVQHPRLRVMRREHERGLSSAIIRGWQTARGELLCVIDADLQHPPGVIVQLEQTMARGADMAVASRHLEGGGVSDWSVARRIVSRTAQIIGLVTLPGVVGRISDPMSGYFMIKRSAIQGIKLQPLGYKILIEVLARGNFPWIGEVPYVFQERIHGGSKATARVYLEYLRHLLRLRLSTLPVNRFLRFALVGLTGVCVDMSLLYLLSDPTTLGWGLTRSKLIASETAIVNNFLWNDLWTFSDVSARQKGLTARLRRFGKFQLICLAGVALNATLLNLQFNLLHMNRYLANAVSIAVVTGWNFWLNLKLSWRVADAPPAAPQD